jgi:hypothetical protein
VCAVVSGRLSGPVSGYCSSENSHELQTTMAQAPTTLFPSIGSVADQTENLRTRDTDESTVSETPTDDDEEKVVQEVESLCMKCEEQVSLDFSLSLDG